MKIVNQSVVSYHKSGFRKHKTQVSSQPVTTTSFPESKSNAIGERLKFFRMRDVMLNIREQRAEILITEKVLDTHYPT